MQRAGLAGLVTAASIGGIALVQGGGAAGAAGAAGTGGPAVAGGRPAAVDFTTSARSEAIQDAAPAIAGPASLRTYRSNSTLVAIPKRTPTASTAPAAAAASAAPRHRKAGPAVTRTVRVADDLDCALPDATTGFRNGRIPRSDLCVIPGTGQRLRSDAAAAWVGLNAAFRAHFGHDIAITDSYRDLPTQKDLFKRKPLLAAVPGTSQHGWGIAVDLASDIQHSGSAEHRWMLRHAPAFGWDNPGWARPGGQKLEPWHWEYTAPGTEPPS